MKILIKLKMSFAVLLFIIFFSDLSYSQEFNYGISFGIGKSSGILTTERYQNSSNSEISHNISFLVFLPTNSNLRVQTGLNYFNVRYNVDVDIRTYILPAPNHIGRNLSFIALPFHLNYVLSFFKNAYLCGGLDVAYLLSAYSDIITGSGNFFNADISDQYKDINLFVALGLGIDIPINNLILFVKPEYTRSISSLTEITSLGSAPDIESFVLNIGLKF